MEKLFMRRNWPHEYLTRDGPDEINGEYPCDGLIRNPVCSEGMQGVRYGDSRWRSHDIFYNMRSVVDEHHFWQSVAMKKIERSLMKPTVASLVCISLTIMQTCTGRGGKGRGRVVLAGRVGLGRDRQMLHLSTTDRFAERYDTTQCSREVTDGLILPPVGGIACNVRCHPSQI